MSQNLTTKVKTIRVSNAVAAGTTAVNCTEVDCQGYDSVRFVALFGTLTATAVTGIKAQQTSVSGSGYADLLGSAIALADTDDNKMAVLEIHRPRERYLRCVVTRATANAVIDGVIAELFNARDVPITADSSAIGNEIHLSPAEGTA